MLMCFAGDVKIIEWHLQNHCQLAVKVSQHMIANNAWSNSWSMYLDQCYIMEFRIGCINLKYPASITCKKLDIDVSISCSQNGGLCRMYVKSCCSKLKLQDEWRRGAQQTVGDPWTRLCNPEKIWVTGAVLCFIIWGPSWNPGNGLGQQWGSFFSAGIFFNGLGLYFDRLSKMIYWCWLPGWSQ